MNKREVTLAFIEAYKSSPEDTQNRTPSPPTPQKTDKPEGNLCCAREYSVKFFVQFVNSAPFFVSYFYAYLLISGTSMPRSTKR
jgi:hypothetical protein